MVQTCIVHQVRQSRSFVSYTQRRALAVDLRAIYTADSETTAEEALNAFETKWSGGHFPNDEAATKISP